MYIAPLLLITLTVLRIRSEPVIFGLLDPDFFSPDPTCNKGYIQKIFYCHQWVTKKK